CRDLREEGQTVPQTDAARARGVAELRAERLGAIEVSLMQRQPSCSPERLSSPLLRRMRQRECSIEPAPALHEVASEAPELPQRPREAEGALRVIPIARPRERPP